MTNFIFKLIRWSGLPWLFRKVIQRNRVTILLFHDIDAERAAVAFGWLKRHYCVIGLQDYLDAVHGGRGLPKRAVIVTFDDGHVGNYDLLPVIRRYGIPVTIFLCSEIVGTHRHFWFKHCQGVKSSVFKRMGNADRLEALRAYGFEQTRVYEDVQALTDGQIREMGAWVDFTCLSATTPLTGGR